jgi:hypothetical protein
VAITRARTLQVVFTSLSRGDLASKIAPDGLLGRYLAYLEAGPGEVAEADGPATGRDAFAREVRQALEARGCRTWEAYRVAGFAVDLVAARDGASIGVDLIGCPGAYADVLDLERYRMLRRAGLPLVPVTWFAWLVDRESAVQGLLSALSERRRPSSDPIRT